MGFIGRFFVCGLVAAFELENRQSEGKYWAIHVSLSAVPLRRR